MRRVIALVLVAAGCFLIVVAGTVKFWVADQLATLPINLYLTLQMTGEATYLDSASGKMVTSDVTSTVTLRGDVKASSDEVAVVDMSTLLETNSGKMLQVTTERVALDRKDAHTVNCCEESVNDSPVKHEGWGAVFPSGTKKQDYPLWDSGSKRAYPAQYKSTTKISGHENYVFKYEVAPYQVSSQVGAGKLVGESADFAVPVWASSRIDYWIEPTTGQAMKMAVHFETTMRNSQNKDVVTALTSDLATAETGDDSPIASTESQLQLMRALRVWAPLGAATLGLVLIVVGFTIRRRASTSTGPGSKDPDIVGEHRSSSSRVDASVRPKTETAPRT